MQQLKFPASASQQRLWFMDCHIGPNPIFNLPTALRLRGPLDEGALRRSFASLTERHESLRTTFAEHDGQLLQVVHAHSPVSMQVSVCAPGAVEQDGRQMVEREATTPFDLCTGPLMRVLLVCLAPEDHLLLITLHHIVADAWSIGILCDDLATLYASFCTGRPNPLPELPLQFADYSEWQREWLAGEEAQASRSYWRERLANLPAQALPAAEPFRRAVHQRADRQSVLLPLALTQPLKEFSREHGCTLFMTLLAGFASVLARYVSESDLAVGVPIASRNLEETKGIIGFFVNMLALRIEVARTSTFQELLRHVRTSLLGAYEHQQLPFEQVVEALHPRRDNNNDPFFQIVFDMHTAAVNEWSFGSLEVAGFEFDTHSAEYGMVMTVVDAPREGLHVRLEYSTELFGRRRMERLLGHYGQVLEQVVRDASQPVWGLDMLTGGEREELAGWSGKVESWAGQGTIGELFTRVAEAQPEAIAVVSEGRQWSYGELNRHANQVANRLRELGVGAESAVGMAMERSLEMVGSLLGILKAGGAYVPLDPEYPQQRLDYLLSDTGARVVIADRRHAGRFATSRSAVLVPDAEGLGQSSATEPTPRATPANLAYILYTSGSTGQPKGVGVTQSSILNLVCGVEYVKLGPEQVLLQYAPLSFDASTFEIWGALLHGARLVVQRPGRASLEELGATIRRQAVTTLWLTTGLFHQMVEQRLDDLAHLHQLLTGGDILNPEIARRACALLPDVRIIHCYGPTEATTFATSCTVEAAELSRSVTIGRPLDHAQVYLLDDLGAPTPAGVDGEIYIGGTGIARGYIAQPAWTAEHFVPDWISGVPGRRLYKTGDWAHYREDGLIEFAGRKDQQVKLRGFRIEMSEIEAALLAQPGVSAATVMVRGEGESRSLVAYLVASPDTTLQAETLRNELKARLPQHMIPAAFMMLAQLPLTANGKIDRQALPEPEYQADAVFEQPATPTEETIARIWSEVLQAPSVGRRDDFFDLGGHSLLATRVVIRLKKEFSVELSLRDFFDTPTVTALAALVDHLRAGRMAALTRQIQSMSPAMKAKILSQARAAAAATAAGATL